MPTNPPPIANQQQQQGQRQGGGGGRQGQNQPTLYVHVLSRNDNARTVEVRARLLRGTNPVQGAVVFGYDNIQVPGEYALQGGDYTLTFNIPPGSDIVSVWAEATRPTGVQRASRQVRFIPPPPPRAPLPPLQLTIEDVNAGINDTADPYSPIAWGLAITALNIPDANLHYVRLNFDRPVDLFGTGVIRDPYAVRMGYDVPVQNGFVTVWALVYDPVVQVDAHLVIGNQEAVVDDLTLTGIARVPLIRDGLFDLWLAPRDPWGRVVFAFLCFAILITSIFAGIGTDSIYIGIGTFAVLSLITVIARATGGSWFARGWNAFLRPIMGTNNDLLPWVLAAMFACWPLLFITSTGTSPVKAAQQEANQQRNEHKTARDRFLEKYSNLNVYDEAKDDKELGLEKEVPYESWAPFLIRFWAAIILTIFGLFYIPISRFDEGIARIRRISRRSSGTAGGQTLWGRLSQLFRDFRADGAPTAAGAAAGAAATPHRKGLIDYIGVIGTAIEIFLEVAYHNFGRATAH